MKLKPYPKYKDPGIEWLGEVPEGWEVKKLKYVAEIEMGQSPDSDFYNKDGEGIPFLQGNADFKEIYPQPQVWTTEGNKYSQKNDILISVRAPVGEINISDERYSIGRGLVALRFNKKTNFKFFYYLFNKAKIYFDSVSTGTTYTSIATDDIKNTLIAIPPLEHQNAIADFLDHQTAKIDELIKKNEKLVELLKEKRQAIISHTVTKGLDPDVKMKDSEIEWIGEILENWGINKIKYTSYVKGRIGWHGLRSDEFTEEGPYLVTGTDFINGTVDWNTCYHISEERYSEDPYIQLKENDLLITKDGTIGKVALVKNLPDKTTLNSGVMLIRPETEDYRTDFMYWILNSKVFTEYIEYTKTGSTVQHLYQETFENFIFPVPKIFEQKNICDYLTDKTLRIDKTIQKIQSQITTLKEYRQALISSVVTGKVGVI